MNWSNRMASPPSLYQSHTEPSSFIPYAPGRTERREPTSDVDYNPPSLLSTLRLELKYSVLGKGLTRSSKDSFRVFSAGLTSRFQVVFLKRLSKKQVNTV